MLKTILFLYKDFRPLLFFGLIAAFCALGAFGIGSIVIAEFAATGKVTHPSTAVLPTALMLVGMLSLSTGVALDTVDRRTQELQRLPSDHVLGCDLRPERTGLDC